MLTVAEAMQRMRVNNATMRIHARTYVVFLNEWPRGDHDTRAYVTDDLEDAVLAAGAMRRRAS